MARINRVVVFGDSFTAGDEHLQSVYYDEFMDYINKNFPRSKLTASGRYEIHPKESDMHHKVTDFQRLLLGSPAAVWHEQFNTTYGKMLADDIGAEAINFARGGNSFSGIFKNITDALEWAEPTDLFVIGDTFIGRETRLWEEKSEIEYRHRGVEVLPEHLQKNYKSIYDYNTIFPGRLWAARSIKKYESYETYSSLRMQYGDDWATHYQNAWMMLLAVKGLLTERKIPYIMINTCGMHLKKRGLTERARPFTMWDDDVDWPEYFENEMDKVHQRFRDMYFEKTLSQSSWEIQKQGRPNSQFFGHYKSNVHYHFAQNSLIPYVRENFL